MDPSSALAQVDPEPGIAEQEHAEVIDVNVGEAERWASALIGGAAIVYGLSRRSPGGMVVAALGAVAVARAATGHCPVYAATGVRTEGEQPAVQVEAGVTISRPARELFDFWRRFENLPRFMKHLQSVETLPTGRTRWVAAAPAGRTVEWHAEVIAEKKDELIAWRALPGSQVPNSGSVRFVEAPEGRGTEVRVSMEYRPPAGPLGAAIARLFGENPEHQIDEDLRRFKQMVEAGEVATIEGQPRGRRR